MKLSFSWTHRELIPIAYKWLISQPSIGVAFKELNTATSNGEYPDVIGFGMGGYSVLLEVKVSRSDFLADKKKFFRKNPNVGMGRFRFFFCPENLIKKEELPEGWGLIYVDENGLPWKIYDPYKGELKDGFWINRHPGFHQNIKAENGLMYSALRRLAVKGHIKSIYGKDEDFQQ